ncbi:MAG: hypothetical protein HYZ38_13990 [Mycobacterium sp.]|nr:hypothetical protein [Mycobacterium sp.]
MSTLFSGFGRHLRHVPFAGQTQRRSAPHYARRRSYLENAAERRARDHL